MEKLELWLVNPKVLLGLYILVILVGTLYAFGAGFDIEEGRNLALVVGAIGALPLAAWRSGVAAKQVELSEAGQNIDRYQKGATMLGDARLSVRQAGVFGLGALAENNPDIYYGTVTKLLCSFIKDRSLEQKQEQANQEVYAGENINADDDVIVGVAPDCLTAVIEILNLKAKMKRREPTEIKGFIDFKGAYLAKADLRGFDLSNAILNDADLRQASLYRADLQQASMCGADLRRAGMSRANLRNAMLQGANLTKASIWWANLSEADLSEADLSGARLMDTDLSEADLSEANLSGAILRETNLSGANLTDADLNGVNLTEVVGLTVEQLETAKNVDPDYLERLRIREQAEEDKTE